MPMEYELLLKMADDDYDDGYFWDDEWEDDEQDAPAV